MPFLLSSLLPPKCWSMAARLLPLILGFHLQCLSLQSCHPSGPIQFQSSLLTFWPKCTTLLVLTKKGHDSFFFLEVEFTMQPWLLWPGTLYVDQAGLELIKICLHLPLKYWNQRHVPLCLVGSFTLTTTPRVLVSHFPQHRWDSCLLNSCPAVQCQYASIPLTPGSGSSWMPQDKNS